MKKKWWGKKGIITEYLPWLLIGIAVIVIIVLAIVLMKDKGISFIDQIKGFLRMG